MRMDTTEIASGLGLTGWVKNLPDGRVEVMAEGSQKKLEELLHKIETKLRWVQIKKTEKTFSEAKNEFKEFEIRF